ncbi:MAG TPA: insulinase family protein, partial [Longimicrobium sp.]|nr:insulinase family protein [Longimicrobium sp.]
PAPGALVEERGHQLRQPLLPGALVEDRALPVLNLDLYVRSGTAADPAGKEGLAQLVASLLDKGAGSRSAVQIAETVEGVGGSIGASASADYTTVSVEVLSDQRPLAFSLLSDVALKPTFPEREVETARTQTLSGLRVALGQPGVVAARMLSRQLYGERHPYGTAPVPATVQAIRRADLTAFHRTHFVPRNAVLVVSGDITVEEAEALARRHFGSWSGGAAPADAFPRAPARSAAGVYLVHRPGSVQSTLSVGNPGLTPASPDYYAVQVLNMVLGNAGDSRLEKILRAEHGWTYSARSSFNRPLGGGIFQAGAEVRTEVTDSALAELMVQLRRIRDEAPTPEEMEFAKGYLVASFPNRFETPGQVGEQIATVLLLDVPVTQLREYQAGIAAVTAEDVQRVARQYVHPDQAAIVVVGDAGRILDKVERIAPVQLFDLEGKPLDRASLVARASTERFDGTRLRPGTFTYAVKFQGNAVGNATYTLVRDGAAWVDTGAMQLGPVNQRSETRFDDALMTSLSKQSAQLPGATTEVELRLEGNRVKGFARLPAQMGGDKTFDTEVVAGTRLPGADAAILSVADLAEGKSFTVPFFNGTTGAVDNQTFRVVGVETVTVPAGTFETFRVEATGGEQASTSWVRRELPHVTVKQEFKGQPVVFELQSLQQ